MMKMVVYPRGDEIDVSEEEIRRGVTHVECLACRGTGEFSITDDVSQECVPCKGTGEVPVSL